MRTMIAALAGLVALTTVSVQAAPLAPAKANPAEVGAAPPVELVRQGCGWGWHRGSGRERCDGRGDRRIFARPVEPGAGEQPHGAMIEARMHAVAVVFDFVRPGGAFRRVVDEPGQLRADPLR